MVQLNGNIPDFHLYFVNNYNQLIGRGETVDSPIHLLFKGYKACQDSEFVRYMTLKEEDYFEGMDHIKDLTHDKLMALATNKYNTLKAKGLWGAKTEQEKQIITLTAQVDALKGNLKLSKPLTDKLKYDKGRSNQDKEKPKIKNKNKKNNKEKKRQKEDEAWKKVPPKAGEANKKEIKGKTYSWCIHHMAWVIHNPAECRLNPSSPFHQPKYAVANSAITKPPSDMSVVASSAEVLLSQLAALASD